MHTTATEEKVWLQQLIKGDEKALQNIFERYYKYLVVTAYNILHDDERAKDMVQDVFFGLWKKREKLNVQGELKPYLRRAVVNRAIDVWRSKKKGGTWEEVSEVTQPSGEASAQQQLEGADLQKAINAAIDSLPERCRQVFALSRFENLSHKEIAQQLDISVKTIENQMTKALRIIRKALAEHGVRGVLILIFGYLS